MLTLDALEAQIHSIEDLQAVVRTMKALAMVSIRQYEKACTSLTHYNAILELGFQGLLRQRHFSENPVDHLPLSSSSPNHDSVGVIVFGSDHGLCGQFNEQIVTYALKQLQHRHIQPDQCFLAAVGARLIPYLEATKLPLQQQFSLPSSLTGTPRLIQDLLLAIEQWCFFKNSRQRLVREKQATLSHLDANTIFLFYNQLLSVTTFQPFMLQLLPVDPIWLNQLEHRPWNSPALPMVGPQWQPLFSGLIRQYLFMALYRATVESLASENAARLSSMQAAEKNIEERLLDLNAEYRQQRQNSITGELLDIVSGFEALKK